ncbi:MAG: cytidylate kinase-like family protein [Lachnospiraceae bacterium]|nr:cytidylate kinase-like family protein [Candidatus Merdinaster equi]
MGNYIITIARGLGSGGSHIAHALAEKLGIPCYDNEILDMAADYSGINESYFYEANERIKKGALAIKNSEGVYNKDREIRVGDKDYYSNENMFNIQAQVMKNLAIEGKVSCIIIGKAANYVLRGLINVVKINIQAPEDKCIKNIMRRHQMSGIEAKVMIEKTDKYRSDYYKYYTGGMWLDPKGYHLSINTGLVSEEYAVSQIISLLKEKNLID